VSIPKKLHLIKGMTVNIGEKEPALFIRWIKATTSAGSKAKKEVMALVMPDRGKGRLRTISRSLIEQNTEDVEVPDHGENV
jgi:hypothetical protein